MKTKTIAFISVLASGLTIMFLSNSPLGVAITGCTLIYGMVAGIKFGIQKIKKVGIKNV